MAHAIQSHGSGQSQRFRHDIESCHVKSVGGDTALLFVLQFILSHLSFSGPMTPCDPSG